MITTIPHIWTVVTYACDNRCSWCYADSNHTTNYKKSMSLESFKSYLNLFLDLGLKNITFIGGEPTSHPNISDMIRYASDKGVTAGLVTNGRRLSDKIFCNELIDAGLSSVAISITSNSAETHDLTTGVSGSFKQSIAGLENVLDSSLNVCTETTISKINYTEAENIAKYLSKYGVKLGFNVCTPCISNSENSNYSLSPKEGADVISRIYSVLKSSNVRMESVTPLPKCLFDQKIFEDMNNKKLLHKSCYIMFGSSAVIDYNGDIIPCVQFTGNPIMNLNKDSRVLSSEEFLEEYNDVNGKPYKFRDSMWYYPSKKCASDCKDFGTTCVAGCPVFWHKYDPDKEIA